MQEMVFINLPTRDLEAADRFYEALGFTKNDMYSSEQASCWQFTEHIAFMVLSEGFFASFLRGRDTPNLRSSQIGNLNAIMTDSVEELDALLHRVIAGGGMIYREKSQQMPEMIDAAVKDPDGHVWEIGWMDMTQMPPVDAPV